MASNFCVTSDSNNNNFQCKTTKNGPYNETFINTGPASSDGANGHTISDSSGLHNISCTIQQQQQQDSNYILVTGGAGYIGSHVVVELVAAGYSPVIVDNLSNSNIECVGRLRQLTRHDIPFHQLDIRDQSSLQRVFAAYKFDAVMHVAGMKSVAESCTIPLTYYNNNITGSISLLQTMEEHSVKKLVFSSSCTVYGKPHYLPIDEAHPTGNCTNSYGRSKHFIEQILRDISTADQHQEWNIVILRYFNPVGAHDSGRLGEDPAGPPGCLMPYVAQVAVGRRPLLRIFGGDYDTPDGTGVRDYSDVTELAAGHVAALRQIKLNCRFKVYNLGTGVGFSVLDIVKAFEKASGKKIEYDVVERRPGDVPVLYADVSLASRELNWKPEKDLATMCECFWRWQSLNPTGYRTQ